MKLKFLALGLLALAVVSCKKAECECTSVYYTDGYYQSSESGIKYPVTSKSQCDAYEVATPEETTTCEYFD